MTSLPRRLGKEEETDLDEERITSVKTDEDITRDDLTELYRVCHDRLVMSGQRMNFEEDSALTLDIHVCVLYLVDWIYFKYGYFFLQRKNSYNSSNTKGYLNQGLPKDIYKLINHNIEAKAIWDNVKMLLAGSELTKEDRESQLYDEFKRFKMLPGETSMVYVRFSQRCQWT
ncbi:hypothetical protein Tco_0377827 [Tanacetum coccineum]